MRPADLDNIYWTQTKGDRQACQKIMKEDVNSNSKDDDKKVNSIFEKQQKRFFERVPHFLEATPP